MSQDAVSREVVLRYDTPTYIHVDIERRKVSAVRVIDEDPTFVRAASVAEEEYTREEVEQALAVIEDPRTDWPAWGFGA